PFQPLPLDRRHDLLGGRRQRQGAHRRRIVRVRTQGHLRRPFLGAAAAGGEGRMRAVFLLGPFRAGRARPLAGAAQLMDPAFYSREYNNRALVPDNEKWVERWTQGSERARATMTCQLDQRYGAAPGETMDI